MTSKTETTLAIVKPDGFKKRLVGRIIQRYEEAGLNLVAMERLVLTREKAEGFYAVHKDRPFFSSLIEFMTSGPVVVMILEGKDAIESARRTMGATNPVEASPGTIRADFGMEIGRNLVHGSDGP